MIDPDLRRFIQNEVSRQMNVILNASAGPNTVESETIDALFPGMPGITGRPVVHPYGFASRAAQGTISVVAKTGEHVGNRMTIGHRDKDRPADLEEGESVVYSLGKYQVRMKNDKLELGKNGVFEVMVVGDTLKEFLIAFLDLTANHYHIGNLGFPTGLPTTKEDFDQAKADYLSNDKILAKDGGRFT